MRYVPLSSALLVLGASLLAPLPAGETPPEAATTPLLSQQEFVAAREQGRIGLVLDVRTAEEFAEGRVPGAVLIPHTELAGRIDEIASHRAERVVVYCRSGRRAAIAEAALREAGFREVLHLEGDMNAWKASELPVESD